MRTKNIDARVCFIGLGYIGLPTAVVAANKYHNVLGVDVNPAIVDSVNAGKIHFVEPGLEVLCEKAVASGKLRASLVPEESEIYLVVVPTPFKGDHVPDISYVEAATQSVLPLLKEGDLFIIESTSPVGTTEKIANLIFSHRPDLRGKLHIAYCPERVLPGNVIYELEHNDRVIGGLDDASTEMAKTFYKEFVKGQLHTTNSRTAEMCKLTENSSRDVQIAFANELSLICDKAGINVWELINLANKHPRVNILQPGCGVGGHCIAVDPWFIVSEYPAESNLISAARRINNYKSFWCVEKIKNSMLSFQLQHGRKPITAIMGLAFKPNIDDLRESPAKYIAERIAQDRFDDDIRIVEPNIKTHPTFKLCNYVQAYKDADIIVFLVAHNEFQSLEKCNYKVILDFCGIFNNKA